MAHTTNLNEYQAASVSRRVAAPHTLIDILDNLIRVCIDSADTFARCSDHTNSGRQRTLFRQRAQACRASSEQLSAMISQIAREPNRSAYFSLNTSAPRRTAVPGSIKGLTDWEILDECERLESSALGQYRNALASGVSREVHVAVSRLSKDVEHNLREIQTLRALATPNGVRQNRHHTGAIVMVLSGRQSKPKGDF